MPRLLGVDLPGKKRVEYSLRYIYGIGPALARQIVEKANVPSAKKTDELTDEEVNKILHILQEYTTEGDLRREVSQNIRRLISINSSRGVRHRKGLPVRGQRTRTNARTRKGPRKTVGAVRGKDARSAAKTNAPPASK
ncbi:MAG: 30S ribosomal protein S13 [bacterium]